MLISLKFIFKTGWWPGFRRHQGLGEGKGREEVADLPAVYILIQVNIEPGIQVWNNRHGDDEDDDNSSGNH